MKKVHLIAFILFLAISNVKAATSAPLAFLENDGQVSDQYRQPRPDIQFSVKASPGLNIFIGNGAIHYQFSKADSSSSLRLGPSGRSPKSHHNLKAHKPNPAKYDMYRMDVELIGADPHAEIIKEEKQSYYENYFNENTGGQTVTAYNYTRITYRNIYPHIDWVLYLKDGRLEHEFIVHEGGRPGDIQLKYSGAKDLKINSADGSLTATTPQGAITEQAPKSYEVNGDQVASRFKLNGDIVSYETSLYKGELVIDPTLQWATYYGGTNIEQGNAVSTDSAGDAYITGYTLSTSGLATSGAHQVTFGGGYSDVYLAKFSSSGAILWSTYYGGSSEDVANGIATDRAGTIYITGTTYSLSGIATSAGYQGLGDTLNGDAFLAKFNSAGAILWGTFFGGINSDNGEGAAADSAGNIFVTGGTASSTGIATPGAYQTNNAAGNDGNAFLAKFNSAGGILWATYYGGGGDGTGAFAVATDAAGSAYITGTTTGANGISTPGAYQVNIANSNATNEAFLAKFNSAGAIEWGTYYGGSSDEWGTGVATDSSGNVFITGPTISTSGIATPGAYQTALIGGGDAFLAKFNTIGGILWATYYGGTDYGGQDGTGGTAVATDRQGNAYITGNTYSTAGIATAGAYQTDGDSLQGNAFLAKFDKTGAIVWASYYGGTGQDVGYGVAADSKGDAYITGTTYSLTGIATAGAYHAAGDSANGNAFLAKFNFCSAPVAGTITGDTSVCIGTAITLADTANGGVWSSGAGIALIDTTGKVTGQAPGSDTITYRVSNTCGSSSTILPIMVSNVPVPVITRGHDTLQTQNFAHYQWQLNGTDITGDTAAEIYVNRTGAYTVVVTNESGCIGSASFVVKTTGVNTLDEAQGISIFPNPASQSCTISLINYHGETISAKLMDMTGKEISDWSFATGSFTFPVSEFAKGVYMLEIGDDMSTRIVRKLVIE
ncbi:unnamed protein product [Sphagnum jensenii]|uniref:Secretion system C-terminal sorting domain-containing protein n=1 Tax=Sphagnum jensenii TaxID=128206 RepID=A0ABP1A054_9BRYO